MKNINMSKTVWLCLAILLIMANLGNAQTYKTPADTVKLNQEYAGLKKDTAELNAEIIKAKGKTDAYQSKVSSTTTQAGDAAQTSKDQAASAANGDNIKAIRKEESKAKKANADANEEADAKKNEKDNDKEIKKLTAQLAKKQKRLSDLDMQRTALMSKSAAPQN